MVHTRTETAIRNMADILKDIKAEKDRTSAELDKINKMDSNIYTHSHKENKRKETKDAFFDFCQKRAGTIKELASVAMEAEKELQALPVDINDTTLANALSMVKSLGKALPLEQQKEIATQFKGNYAAEKVLRALYDDMGLYHKINLTDAESLTTKLYMAIVYFNNDYEKSASIFRAVEREANALLEALNSSYRMDIGVSEASFWEHIHASAGLEMKK